MKHAKNITAITVAAFMLCYLCGSFVAASFNIVNWSESMRGGTVGAFAGAAAMGVLIYGMVNSNDRF